MIKCDYYIAAGSNFMKLCMTAYQPTVLSYIQDNLLKLGIFG